MRYKLQTWEYDIFSNEEAECHLEEMAEKGWALFKITQEWMPIACYRREAAAAGRRYAVTAVPDDAEDFFRMCEDAGWKRSFTLETGSVCWQPTIRKPVLCFRTGTRSTAMSWR